MKQSRIVLIVTAMIVVHDCRAAALRNCRTRSRRPVERRSDGAPALSARCEAARRDGHVLQGERRARGAGGRSVGERWIDVNPEGA